jgi:hypothetical protein
MKKILIMIIIVLFANSLFAVPLGTPKYITIHHSGVIIDQNKPNYDSDYNSVKKYHIEVKKWDGIGYHFLIAPNGKIYTGRPITKKGAHCKVLNRGNIGICLFGNFNKQQPTEKQTQSLRKLVKQLKTEYKTIKKVKKHSDFMDTECPGKNINLKTLVPAEEK